jgi:hypothetical protein
MAYDRRLNQISAKDYHNENTETKETSHFGVTLATAPLVRHRPWMVCVCLASAVISQHYPVQRQHPRPAPKP